MNELVTCGAALKTVNKSARTVDFVASTEAIDSYGEIVSQNWDLTRFLANPVILFGHDSRDLPVGKATRCEVVTQADGTRQLECTIEFATADMNPLAEQVWQSILGGMLRAVSVGFVPGDIRWEKRDGVDVLVLDNNELHEISVVPIPANPEALAKMRARAAKQREQAGDGEGNIDMNLEEALKKNGELEGRVSQVEAARAVLEKENTTLKTSLAKIEKEFETTATARDTATERAEKAETKLVESDVEALVGKKILPAEKEEMIELAKSNRKLFDKLVAKRPDLNLTASVMKSGNGEVENKAAANNGTSAGDEVGALIADEE